MAVSAVAAETTPGTLVTVMPKGEIAGVVKLIFRFLQTIIEARKDPKQ